MNSSRRSDMFLGDDPVGLTREHSLYGRVEAITNMLSALDRVNCGSGELLLIPGVSGAGKTALAQVLSAPTRARNGAFIQGKFNQYDQNVPFVAWRQALSEFCETVNREDESLRESWITDIRRAVGENGQLLLDLVPEFSGLLGRQAPVAAISPQESRHRFSGLIRALLQVMCRAEHPLVLFLDDWQWADPASLHLLTQLQLNTNLRYLLIIAAYRSDEVREAHPWMLTLTEIREQGVPIEALDLACLSVTDLQRLASERLALSDSVLRSLAERLHERTQGNPFFAQALIDDLIQQQAACSAAQQPPMQIDSSTLSADVAGLFESRLRALPESTQRLLSLAACLGHRFDADTLGMVSGIPVADCVRILLETANGLVVAVKSTMKHGAADGDRRHRAFRFLHDRVQQAAYAWLPHADLRAVQLQIARKMLSGLTAEQLHDRACEVAEFLNAAIELVSDPAERLQGAELNVAAARKARSATAFRAALQYHRAARSFLEQSEVQQRLWRDHHELALALYREQAETEFLEGDREASERCIRIAVTHARTPLEKADTLSILITHHTLQANYEAAIATGRETLAALGITLPERDFTAARDAEIRAVRERLLSLSVAELQNLPAATDPVMKTAARVLITMGPPCYRSHQDLWSVIVPRVVSLTLQYGHIPQVGYSYTAFAGLLGWVANDYETGRTFCELATSLMSGELVSAADKTVFHLMIGSSARHWSGHLRHSSEDYAMAVQIGSQSDNLQYAAYAYGHNMYCRFFQGTDLELLLRETQASLTFSRTRFNQWAIDLLRGGLQLFGELAGSLSPAETSRDWEQQYFAEVERHHNHQVLCIYRVMQTVQKLLFGDYRAALAVSNAAVPSLAMVGTQGLLPWPEHVFARVMALTTVAIDEGLENVGNCQPELKNLLSQLAIWSESCPENFLHKYLLAQAEMRWLNGDTTAAANLYQQAADLAHEGGFVQWEAFASERAARLWNSLGEGRLEHLYWQQAWLCFDRWGARTRAASLLSQYQRNLADELRGVLSPSNPDAPAESKGAADLVAALNVRIQQQVQAISLSREQAATMLRAEELAHAAESLRLSVAERRRISAELREQRDAQREMNEELERRVNERTAELTAAKTRLRTVLESAPVAMVMVDGAGRLALVNSELEWLFGYERTDLVGRPLDLLIPGWAHSFALHPLSEVSQSRLLITDPRLRATRRDGTLFPIEIGLNPVETRDGSFTLLTITDIEERQATMQALQTARDAAEAASRAKSDFLANMSHELRTPMNAIIGYSEILKEECADAGHTDYLNDLEKICFSGRHLLHLINDVLDLSKVEAGRMQVFPEDLLLPPFLDEVVDSVSPLIQQRGNALTINVGADLGTARTDAIKLRQILYNLLSNAAKFTQQGQISLHAHRVERAGSAWLQLSISDTGIGMTADQLQKVFQAFTQADLSITRRFGGTGLGLTITRHFCELLGGSIAVSSEAGLGTRFEINLPMEFTPISADEGAADHPDDENEVPPVDDCTEILVVDDDPNARDLLRRYIERQGFSVITADCGIQGLKLAQTRHPAAIILDVTMPDLDGRAVLEQLQQDPATREIPVVIVSMMDHTDFGLTPRVRDYLTKPPDRQRLGSILTKLRQAPENFPRKRGRSEPVAE